MEEVKKKAKNYVPYHLIDRSTAYMYFATEQAARDFAAELERPAWIAEDKVYPKVFFDDKQFDNKWGVAW